MWSRVFPLIFFLAMESRAWTAPADCFRGRIKTQILKEEKVVEDSYCTNEDGTELLSQNCRGKKPCLAMKASDVTREDLYLNPVGTASFALCEKLKGEGQIIQISLKDKSWASLDRCLFPDGSYMDTGSLLEFHIKD